MIQGNDYISSSGKKTAITDMPHPYLVNARNKAETDGDDEAVRVLTVEINSRPEQ